jgi:hypothetical protein
LSTALFGIWTVYDHPADYPDGFIARLHQVFPGLAVATEHTITAATLDQLRGQLPPHLHCVPRRPADEITIVESWI